MLCVNLHCLQGLPEPGSLLRLCCLHCCLCSCVPPAAHYLGQLILKHSCTAEFDVLCINIHCLLRLQDLAAPRWVSLASDCLMRQA